LGWKLDAFAFLLAVWSLVAGALLIGIPLLVFLFYRWSKGRQKQGGLPNLHPR
jgi:hypothetical protein